MTKILHSLTLVVGAAILHATGYGQNSSPDSLGEALSRLGADVSILRLDSERNVELLSIRSARLDLPTLRLIAALPALKSLTFQGNFHSNQVSAGGFLCLNECQHLGTITFACSDRMDSSLLEVLPKLTKVRTLRFMKASVGASGCKWLSKCEQLESLEIDEDCGIDDDVLRTLIAAPRLKKLILKGTAVSSKWKSVVGSLGLNQSLQEIRLYREDSWEVWKRRPASPVLLPANKG